MKILVIIFSYNREESLKEVIDTLHYTERQGEAVEVVVLDDGSPFTIDGPNFIKLPHTGKKGFFRKWADAFYIIEKSRPDLIVFMPDDFKRASLNKIVSLHRSLKGPYCFNIINDGRNICWTGVKPGPVKKLKGVEYKRVGFVDCGFFCNLAAIEKLKYTIFETSPLWFDRPDKSSGVGYQLSRRLKGLGVKMYKPIRSLAEHGEEPSVMHTDHREKTPLKSL